jgi:hypothetical protein
MTYQKIKTTFIIVLLFTFLAACSSPESDGKKVAKQFCNCEKEKTDVKQKELSKLIQNFDAHNFQTRIAAREKVQTIDDKAAEQYRKCLQKVQENYRKTSGKYATNRKKNSQFEYAFKGYYTANVEPDNKTAPLVSQLNNMILTIIPPKPDLEKIKKDLIGRKITERSNGYHRQGWYWLIEEGEIKDIQIISENKQGEAFFMELQLILQANGGAHKALINLTYILRQNDDWTIDFLKSKDINIIRTGNYDNCMTVQRAGWSGEFYLEFANHCDVALVVGGVVLSQYGSEWKKFSVVVEASKTNTVGGLFSISVIDYEIHFIERP